MIDIDDAIRIFLPELLVASEADDMIVWCEQCGAPMDRGSRHYSSAEDVTLCRFAATMRDDNRHLCRKEAWNMLKNVLASGGKVY